MGWISRNARQQASVPSSTAAASSQPGERIMPNAPNKHADVSWKAREGERGACMEPQAAASKRGSSLQAWRQPPGGSSHRVAQHVPSVNQITLLGSASEVCPGHSLLQPSVQQPNRPVPPVVEAAGRQPEGAQRAAAPQREPHYESCSNGILHSLASHPHHVPHSQQHRLYIESSSNWLARMPTNSPRAPLPALLPPALPAACVLAAPLRWH